VRRAELVFAAGLVVAGLVFLQEALRLPTGWTPSGPGPGFFPFWLATGFTLTGLVVLARTWKASHDPTKSFAPPGAWKRVLVVFLPMVGVVAFLHTLGIYLGGGLYLAAYARFVGRHRWPLVLAVSIGVPLVLFFVFERWFVMPLPKGTVLEWWLYGRR
jgi:putative tricarboxylic transport membrane protein